jgi:DNA polymerase III subunit epsilon
LFKKIVVDIGGVIKCGVSSKTHYLVDGIQDKSLVGEDGLSTKEEKEK